MWDGFVHLEACCISLIEKCLMENFDECCILKTHWISKYNYLFICLNSKIVGFKWPVHQKGFIIMIIEIHNLCLIGFEFRFFFLFFIFWVHTFRTTRLLNSLSLTTRTTIFSFEIYSACQRDQHNGFLVIASLFAKCIFALEQQLFWVVLGKFYCLVLHINICWLC